MQEQTLESCLVQLVELKPPHVNERSAPRERDDAENGGGDDGEDDEEGGAFPLNGSKLSRGGYLHIIPRNSRMCLIRRYLSVRPVDATPPTRPTASPWPLNCRSPSVSNGVYVHKPLLPKATGFP